MQIMEATPPEMLTMPSHSSVDVGRCLRIAQVKYDVKSAELANRLETFPQQVVRWRSNEDMRVQTLVRICNAIGISVDEFLELQE